MSGSHHYLDMDYHDIDYFPVSRTSTGGFKILKGFLFINVRPTRRIRNEDKSGSFCLKMKSI